MTTAGRPVRPRGDRGEGAISTVLALLIMALLGAAMWLTFENIWSDSAGDAGNPAEVIDSDVNSGGAR